MSRTAKPSAAMSLHIPESSKLPDNASFTNRFEVRSQSSNAIYTVAQSKSGRWWSCSCPGWIRHRHCKHLETMSLPGHHIPKEIAPNTSAKRAS